MLLSLVFENVFFSFLIVNQSSGQFGINYAFIKFKNDRDGDTVHDVDVR